VTLATLVYRRLLLSEGVTRRLWSVARRILISLCNDPSCALTLHGRLLTLPLSHNLPLYLSQYPHYDRLPSRISEYIHSTQGHLTCIDVGANIGDSIASLYLDNTDTFLAIEPYPKFHEFLTANWSSNHNVTPLAVACSSDAGPRAFVVHEKRGTASLRQAPHAPATPSMPLDLLAKQHPHFMAANLLKIDTDGMDFEVIAGAAQLISASLPAVLFECEASSRPTYVEDCLDTLRFFRRVGYEHFLVYDNFGTLMGKYSLADLSVFQNLLFYQLTGFFEYFDLLVMGEDDLVVLWEREIDYFAEHPIKESLQPAARAAARLRREG
jgi:FkbM family methyltransferase